MKIRFQNLGQIKDTELEVKPLTVIIGPNNSNKTYIACSLYGIWQRLRNARLNSVESSLRQLTTQDNTINFDIEFFNSLEQDCQSVVNHFADELQEFYQDSSGRLFTRTQFNVELSESEVRSLPNCVDQKMLGEEPRQYQIEANGSAMKIRRIKPTDMTDAAFKRLSLNLSFTAARQITRLFTQALFPKPYLLPAERNAFIITYKVLQNRRMKLLLDQQRMILGNRKNLEREFELLGELGEIRYPQPTEDFLALLSDIELESSFASRRHKIDTDDDEVLEINLPPRIPKIRRLSYDYRETNTKLKQNIFSLDVFRRKKNNG